MSELDSKPVQSSCWSACEGGRGEGGGGVSEAKRSLTDGADIRAVTSVICWCQVLSGYAAHLLAPV